MHPVTGARYSLPSGHPNPNPGAVFRTRGGSWFYRDGRLAQDLKWGLKRPGSTAEAARQGPLVFSEEVREQELKYRAERRARGERGCELGLLEEVEIEVDPVRIESSLGPEVLTHAPLDCRTHVCLGNYGLLRLATMRER